MNRKGCQQHRQCREKEKERKKSVYPETVKQGLEGEGD